MEPDHESDKAADSAPEPNPGFLQRWAFLAQKPHGQVCHEASVGTGVVTVPGDDVAGASGSVGNQALRRRARAAPAAGRRRAGPSLQSLIFNLHFVCAAGDHLEMVRIKFNGC